MSASFRQWVQDNYQVAHGAIITDEDIDSELAALEDE
jgi:hypothetical protein